MKTTRNTILPVMAGVRHFAVFAFVVSMAYLGGCSSDEESRRLLDEKGRLEKERDGLRQELFALKQDWAILQNEDSSAKLIQELREELRKAAEYKSTIQKQLDSNIGTIEWLRSENSTLKNKNEQANKTLNELQNKLAVYQSMEQAAIRQQVKGSVYAGVGGGHWIRETASGGGIIVLEDGSVWEVSSIDRVNTMLWLPVTQITVLENPRGFFPYLLVNTDDGEKAEAKYIGQQ